MIKWAHFEKSETVTISLKCVTGYHHESIPIIYRSIFAKTFGLDELVALKPTDFYFNILAFKQIRNKSSKNDVLFINLIYVM